MRISVAAACVLVLLAPEVPACIWDQDTLAVERARFPEAADIVSGNFPRHSREFYEWRKLTTSAQLAQNPAQPALYDDLAVVQHKLGDHRAAIATMLEKEKVAPGKYETYSNLGTFCIYTGELDEALQWIDKALTINANAHFGREKYQRLLVAWLKAGKPQGENAYVDIDVTATGFADFLLPHDKFIRPKLPKDQREAAIKGVLGMMRFADFDNPLLLEALGDLLLTGSFEENAAHLASQAYVLAIRRSNTDEEKKRLWKKFAQAGGTSDHFIPAQWTRELDASLAVGIALNAKVRKDELMWISQKLDANAEFERKYLLPAR